MANKILNTITLDDETYDVPHEIAHIEGLEDALEFLDSNKADVNHTHEEMYASMAGYLRCLDDGQGNSILVLGSAQPEKIIIPYNGKPYSVYPEVLAEEQTWYKGVTDKTTITTINIVDTYTPTGNETETWNADAYNLGLVKCYIEGTTLTIAGNGRGVISANPNSKGAFVLFTSVTAINGTDILDVSGCATTRAMFDRCKALVTLDVSNWDLRNNTSIRAMFQQCFALTSLDVSNWDVSNVVEAKNAFYECTSLTAIEVGKWNTSKMMNMGYIFDACSLVTEIDVSNWDTSSATNMHGLFKKCNAIKTVDVSKWDTSNVTDFGEMFSFCYALVHVDVSNWDTRKATNMAVMFQQCNVLTALDVSKWDTSNVADMSYMFKGCNTFTSLDVSNWDTSNVTNMKGLFATGEQNSDISSLVSLIGIENWDVSKVTNMDAMFYSCSKLTHIDVSNWDMTSVQTVSHMFCDCLRLASIDITKWRLDSCLTMDGIFNDCASLTSIDVTNVLTPSVTELSQTFEGCTNLQQIIGLNTWDTSKVKTFDEMFQNCGIAILDLSSFDTSSATTGTHVLCSRGDYTEMTNMFRGCNYLSQVTFGSAFEFKGTNCYLPAPSAEYITGADGKWYNRTSGVSYEPSAIPSNTAATYHATAV